MMGSMKWLESDIEMLISLHKNTPYDKIAEILGRTRPAIRNKIWRMGLGDKRIWTKQELQILEDNFNSVKFFDSNKLAVQLGRSVDALQLKASRLGFGNSHRPRVQKRKEKLNKFSTREEYLKHVSNRTKEFIKTNGHPRGALGLKHTDEAKKKMSDASKLFFASVSKDKKAEMKLKAMKTKYANGTYARNGKAGSWMAGWREIGGIRKYYRSRWEANYAYYLQWLKENGEILDWKHEPTIFWFEGIKRGTNSYLPDFWVKEKNGNEAYHEVKGWMDDRSKTKISRMAKYHPEVTLIVIDSKAYESIKKSAKYLVQGWEE